MDILDNTSDKIKKSDSRYSSVEIGRFKKSPAIEIIIRRFDDTERIDIREYIKSKNYNGFSRKGINIHISAPRSYSVVSYCTGSVPAIGSAG